MLIPCIVYGSSKLPDTSGAGYSRLQAGLSVAFHNSVNWRGEHLNSLLMASDIDYLYAGTRQNANQIIAIKFEMGFTWFSDSVWDKHADQMNLQYILKSARKRFSNSFSVLGTTHFLNSYDYLYNSASQGYHWQKTESLFNPSTLEMGGGTGYTLFKKSVVNISLATARLRVIPKVREMADETGIPVSKLKNGSVYFDYGFAMQYYINEELTGRLEIISNARVFIKAFHRDELETEINHKITFRIWRGFRLHADCKMKYTPSISYKMQFRNEILFGFFYRSGDAKN